MIRRCIVIVCVCLTSSVCSGEPPRSPPPADNVIPYANVDRALPAWLPFPIPLVAYQKWRKFGAWDYTQLGSRYRESTMFNFGATAKAAGLDQEHVLQLVHASRATPEDVAALDEPETALNFKRNASRFEHLRTLADRDIHLRRIAYDYTDVDEATARSGDTVGLTPARWTEYKRLFDELSLTEGILRSEDHPGAIFFIHRAKGLCTGGSSSGYVHSTTEPGPLITSSVATAIETEGREKHIYTVWVFRRLAPQWYAFYQIN